MQAAANVFQDVVRATITRVIHDKILLGLVIVGILGIFVGGFATSDDANSAKHSQKEVSEQSDSPAKSDEKPAAAEVSKLEPSLAADFVKWWMRGAMDYSAASAASNHEAAFRWMTPEATQSFCSSLWTPDTATGVAQGLFVAAFQPVSVQAAAINPDGSVVVTLTGTLVTQSSGRPVTQQLQMDLLVRKESDGLRIAGVYNRIASVPGNSVY